LHCIVEQTLTDPERGYGKLAVQVEPDGLAHLVNVANGDARSLLNALELAVETTPPAAGVIHVTLAVAEESIQQRAVLYDKEGMPTLTLAPSLRVYGSDRMQPCTG